MENVDPENVDIDVFERVGIQLPNADAEAIKVIRKDGHIQKGDAVNKQSPDKQSKPRDDYYKSSSKSPSSNARHDKKGDDNEEDLENMKMRTMIIDLSQQKIPPAYSRLLRGIKVFGKEYICDCFSCTLMILFLLMLAFVILCQIVTTKDSK